MKAILATAAIVVLAGAARGSGPDVILSNIPDVTHYGPVHDIHAYSIGSNTCNIGDANLAWTNGGTPGLAMNMFRIHDGRLTQIGQGWVKTACCAAASPSCNMSCNGAGGSQLGAGCMDTYGAGYNAGQTRLGPRSGINAWTGQFQPLPSGSGDAIFRRLQVVQNDLTLASFPNSQFFVEGVYVGSDDAQAGNRNNNATFRRITVNQSNFDISLSGAQVNLPAIQAMRDHANGSGQADPSVVLGQLDVPGEGRFWYGVRVRNLGGGMYRYDYNVYNLSSDRAGGSLSIPMPSGAIVQNAGFSFPVYHSGEPYPNIPWTRTRTADAIKWTSPHSFAQNPNSNALRWGTMYSFWFDCNVPPANRDVTLGLFKPGTPNQMTIAGIPAPRCRADFNNSGGTPDDADIVSYFTMWDQGDASADFNGSGGTPDDADLVVYFTEWSGGC